MKKKTAVVALRSAIIAGSIDGQLSSAGIMDNLPGDFGLADNGKSMAPERLPAWLGASPGHLPAFLVRVPAQVCAGQPDPAC